MSLNLPLPILPLNLFDFTPKEPVNPKLALLQAMAKEDLPDLLEWTIQKRPFLGPSRKFNLDRHRYLRDIYRCQAKEVVVMKASQMGASEWLVSYALHACDQRTGNVFYVFPTEAHVSDFSTARLGPAIESSDYLNKIIIDGSGHGGFKGSDRITLKRIRDRFLYFRGSKVQADGNAPQLKSVDADILILDEVDELDPRAPAIAKKRLGHAREDLGNVLWVSTPTYPGMGIYEEWLKSSQQLWFIACEHCGTKQSLEIGMCVFEWDSLGRPYQWHGKEAGQAYLACKHCGKPLNRLVDGEWVATYPDREVVGFHLSKLFSAQMKLDSVVANLDTVDETKKREAFNQDLGLPFIPRGGHLETETLDNCRKEYGHGPDPYKTCYMGIDVGRVLNVIIRSIAQFETGETKQLYAAQLEWSELDRIMKIYRPKRVVIDALPETTKAREFQGNYSYGVVWLAYYPNFPQGNKREDYAIFDPKETRVLIDRTRSLDATYAGFYGATSTLPFHARNIRDYYDQLRASIRVLKEDTTGQEVATYIETGPDHYSHAENYAHIASLCKIGMGWAEGSS